MLTLRSVAATMYFGRFGQVQWFRGRCAHIALNPLCGGFVSWRASAYVKPLVNHADGTPLTAREKLILFVLADSHNEERGNCAWISVPKAAKAALTSERRFSILLKRLEEKGTLLIQRREGRTNLYQFPGLHTPAEMSGVKKQNVGGPPLQLQHPTPATATTPEPSLSLEGTDIQPLPSGKRPVDFVDQAIRESQRTGESADDIMRRLMQ